MLKTLDERYNPTYKEYYKIVLLHDFNFDKMCLSQLYNEHGIDGIKDCLSKWDTSVYNLLKYHAQDCLKQHNDEIVKEYDNGYMCVFNDTSKYAILYMSVDIANNQKNRE